MICKVFFSCKIFLVNDYNGIFSLILVLNVLFFSLEVKSIIVNELVFLCISWCFKKFLFV